MKLIYSPKKNSPAEEYSKYAVSVFEGCKDKPCDYCYMSKMAKRFNKYFAQARLKPALIGKDIPNLFEKELRKNLSKYQKDGMFFYFNTDPFLPQTKDLTEKLIYKCWINGVEATLLTKQTEWIRNFDFGLLETVDDKNIKFGFSLTGMDEFERDCSSNIDRIGALKYLHNKGFTTWVSLEPCIDLSVSLSMFKSSYLYTDSYKIGLLSGKKFDKKEVVEFVKNINSCNIDKKDILFKNSILKYILS